jgi:hypothetical protein
MWQMMYINKFGMLKLLEEPGDLSNNMWEETIDILASRKSDEI